jgi:lipopolysaccharide transport system ATP-binding protein
MSALAIQTHRLGKRYRLGERQRYQTLRDTLASFASAWNGRGRPKPQEHVWALRDVSVEVRQGESVGIIGPNGAGKTTLLKILSRITEPTEGSATVWGRVGSLLEVGTGFHPELTGRENIYLNGAILGMGRAEIARRFDEIVAFAEVARFLETPVKHYSSGMRVRLSFSVAAHLDAEILLVDEVLAVGDAAFQKKCLEKMEGVSGKGRTVLFVSHNMAAVTSLCQRGILLIGGRVVMDDRVEQTVPRYLAAVRKYQLPVDGRVSLVSHPGRRKQAEGLIRLTSCWLLNQRDEPTTCFRSGNEVKVAIGYEMTFPVDNAEVVFVLVVNDSQQRRLFSCSNDVVGCTLKSLPTAGEVVCVIPRLPLAPGSYSMNIGCRVGPSWSDGVYEAVYFEVVAGEFHASGRLPPEGFGQVLVDHEWFAGMDRCPSVPP